MSNGNANKKHSNRDEEYLEKATQYTWYSVPLESMNLKLYNKIIQLKYKEKKVWKKPQISIQVS